jgi:hypothetical protein
MKKMIFSAFATVAFGSMALAGEKAVVAEAVCNCKPATKTLTLKPVEVKVVKVETVKAYVAEECCTAGARRTARLRDRLAARRAPVVVVAEAPCCTAATAAKK